MLRLAALAALALVLACDDGPTDLEPPLVDVTDMWQLTQYAGNGVPASTCESCATLTEGSLEFHANGTFTERRAWQGNWGVRVDTYTGTYVVSGTTVRLHASSRQECVNDSPCTTSGTGFRQTGDVEGDVLTVPDEFAERRYMRVPPAGSVGTL